MKAGDDRPSRTHVGYRNWLEAVSWRLLNSILAGSPYGDHRQGRGVCVWCNGRSAVLEMNHRQPL